MSILCRHGALFRCYRGDLEGQGMFPWVVDNA